jgi:hypothetical protein
MITRLQQFLFALLLVGCVALSAILIRMREQAQDRLAALPQPTPLVQPVNAPEVPVTWMMPNDVTGELTPMQQTLALPSDPSERACDLLNQLIASWSTPGSPHPIDAKAGVESVFLLQVPGDASHQLAVVNFNAAFPPAQPSGIEPETLTLLSIIQTLHANFPSIEQVRFLVDGHPQPTLAGHADLMRTYQAENAAPSTAP